MNVKIKCDDSGSGNKFSSSVHVIKCTHVNYISKNKITDFAELWNGSGSKKNNSALWGGDFTGRPGLADDLFEAVKGILLNKDPSFINTTFSELRCFWRYIDSYEKILSIPEESRIDSVGQIDTILGLNWLRPVSKNYMPASAAQYRTIYSIIKTSMHSLGLTPVYWPPIQGRDSVTRKDTPSIADGITLVRVLTKCAHAIWKRWERADVLAESGRILNSKTISSVKKMNVVEADIHATYRELIRRSGNPSPSLIDLYKFIGISSLVKPSWWPRHSGSKESNGRPINLESDLLPGLYPTTSDLYCLSSLLMARSGWNAATTFALNCSHSDLWSRNYGDGLVWIFSYKDRAGHWQDTISPENHATHSYQIIIRLINRNAALRKLVMDEPTKCALPDVAPRSPWLCIHDTTRVGVLGQQVMNKVRNYLKKIIKEYNSGKDVGSQLPLFKPSDFRDVFAEAVHRGGNYSIFLTQIALGHKSLASTRRYLRSVAWRKESETQLNDLVVGLFDQIETHRKIDLTLLRAKMDGVIVTQAHIDRLESFRKNKTYSGLYCSDPTNPPEWIEPRNPGDGSEVCKQGHRCASCPKGKVFEDSLSYIARYTAELEWKQTSFGDVRWYQSTDSLDLEVYRQTLKQWPTDDVDAHLRLWRDKIVSGEHHVLIFSAGV